MQADLLDKTTEIAKTAASVSDADKQRWNQAATKALGTEEAVKDLRKEFDALNTDQIKTDITNINQIILTLQPRADFEAL